MQRHIIFSFLPLLTGSILKDAKGSQAGSRHDSNNCEKDGEGGNQGTGAVVVCGATAVACGCSASAAACPWVHPEAQKPSWHRGIAIQKVFARPESFCA